jgi:hypothetical protein
MTSSELGQGRPLAPAPLHRVPIRDLTAAMRQIRAASGDTLDTSAEILNATLASLHPDIGADVTSRPSRYSQPHKVNKDYLSDIERGNNATYPVPKWLRDIGVSETAEEARGSRVRPWLVWAYDAAFGADGYLIDMYTWASELHADYEHDPPRRTRNLPAHIPDGEEYTYLSARFPDAPQAVDRVLRTHGDELRARRGHVADDSWHWRGGGDKPRSFGDGDETNPEGVLASPGEYRVVRWTLQNAGTRPWRDRIMYRIGQTKTNLVTPPLIPLPDADPGDRIEIHCPVLAPDRPGTYRLCLKMGWPNGVYCFPTRMLGLVFTLIVPAEDLADCYDSWAYR